MAGDGLTELRVLRKSGTDLARWHRFEAKSELGGAASGHILGAQTMAGVGLTELGFVGRSGTGSAPHHVVRVLGQSGARLTHNSELCEADLGAPRKWLGIGLAELGFA